MFRVIVLKIDVQTYRERLLNHECNFPTESKHELSSCESSMTDPDYKLDVHSNNYKDIIEQDVITVLCLLKFSYSKFK